MGQHVKKSEANGGLMRVAPLACWLATHPQEDRNTAITTECALTHVNRICIDANLLYVHTIIDILTHPEQSARELYGNACVRAIQMGLSDSIPERLNLAETAEPDYEHNIGWVLIALQATYYHLLNTPDFEEALVRVVSAGGRHGHQWRHLRRPIRRLLRPSGHSRPLDYRHP